MYSADQKMLPNSEDAVVSSAALGLVKFKVQIFKCDFHFSKYNFSLI